MNRKRRGKTTLRPKAPGRTWSEQAKKNAEAVLEVLAGTMTPQEAAGALGMSFSRYYILEAKAVEGMIGGCEPCRKGRTPTSARELDRLREANQQLTRQVTRYQALVRATHRTVGLTETKTEGKKGKRRPKRPTIRALKFSQSLKQTNGETPANTEANQLEQQLG